MTRVHLALGAFLILASSQGRKLGGDHHQHDHHEHDSEHEDHEHEHDHHQDQDVEIEALESNIESVFAAPATTIETNYVGEWSQWSAVGSQNFQSVPSNREFRPIFNLNSNSLSNEYDVVEAIPDFSIPDYDQSDESNESDESTESDESDESDESIENNEITTSIEENALFDISKATRTVLDDGSEKYCVEKVAYREELKKDPVLSCVHKKVEKCHYTYTTQFIPVTEEVCDPHYEKRCTITYKQVAQNDTLVHCYNPLVRKCEEAEEGEEECRDYHETSCTTRYVEKSPGKFVGDTACEKVPVNYCTSESCSMVPGPQECHDKVVTSVVDHPEEHCDLVPQKTCRHKTTLVPRLRPEPECVEVPQEVCDVKYVNVRVEKVPYQTLWCQDDEEEEVGLIEEDVLPEAPRIEDEPVTEGYQYDVPENPLTIPPKTTTSLPVVESEPFIPAEPVPPPPTTTPSPPSPPSPSNTVQLTPDDLQAAITEAIRRSVAASVAEAIELRRASENQQRLESSVRKAVELAVRRAVIKSVQEQAASKKMQSSRDLETAVTTAIKEAVTRAVEQSIKSRVTMTTSMKSEMKSIENQVKSAVLQTIRSKIRGAINQQRSSVTQAVVQKSSSSSQESVEEAVRKAVIQAVTAAVQSQVSGLTVDTRRDINTGIQTAVQTSISDQMERSQTTDDLENVRQAVLVAVMSKVRSAVNDQLLSGNQQSTSAARQSLVLIQKLNNAVRQAVENQLRRRLSQTS